MIVVRTNLCRARPPRLRGARPKVLVAAAASMLLAGMITHDLSEWRSLTGLRAQTKAAQDLAAGLEDELIKARAVDAALNGSAQRRNILARLGTAHRNWAPVLGEALAAVPPNVVL